MSKPELKEESFRDSIATVNADGSRIWIYPKKPDGKFYNWRGYVSWVLLALLFGIPFIKIGGDPIFLFNVIERKFILFSIVFTPQDMHLFALAMITLILFIVLFTVVFGRLFCGWVCPQTIFMEMVFRKIEYWIEGDAGAQRRLNKADWNSDKILKKGVKHLLFFAISVLIANTFLAYIIGVDQVGAIVTESISLHVSGFIAMIIFSLIFYGVFAFFREQVCIAVCPYGRLQGVLLVPNSIVVMYDWIRGEPRGKIRKKRKTDAFVELPVVEPVKGDCVDCDLCVKVCPTGIDIRNGTQLECVNCTACMDACDNVMNKIGRPEGLIRYDSFSNVDQGKQKIFTARVWAYTAALLALLIFQGFLLANRSDMEVILLRTPGMMYQEVEDNYISNLYNYQLINKTAKIIGNVSFEIDDPNARIKLVGKVSDIPKMEFSKGSLFIEYKKESLEGRKNKVKVKVFSEGKLVDEVSTNFMGPIK